MPQRLRVKHRFSFHKRLAMWAEQVREQAARLPIGPEREALLQKAAQAETASSVDGWANSPGLQPLK
jgi:hypothetical protein